MSRAISAEFYSAVSGQSRVAILPFLVPFRTSTPVRLTANRSLQHPSRRQRRQLSTTQQCRFQVSAAQRSIDHPFASDSLEDEIPWATDPMEGQGEGDSLQSKVLDDRENFRIDEWEHADILDMEDEVGFGFDETFPDDLPEPIAQQKAKSTITASERQAFKRIFANIMGAPPVDPKGEIYAPAVSEVHQAEISQTIDTIMKHSISGDKKDGGDKAKSKSKEEMVAAVEQYPPSLRLAAAKAIGLVVDQAAPEEDTETLNAQRIEALYQGESARIEALMHNASNDMELWKIMEKHVFSMGQRLDIERGKGTYSQRLQELQVIGPLYPLHLLLGFRLLDRGFARPSPLALHILPRVKSLGLTSHAFGASTELYNELIRVVWSRYGDIRMCVRLFREMDSVGLEFDQSVLRTTTYIMSEQARIKTGTRGQALSEIYQLPEFSTSPLWPWYEKAKATTKKLKSAEDAKKVEETMETDV